MRIWCWINQTMLQRRMIASRHTV